MSKKILIIGNSAKEYALAKCLSKNNQIYVTPSSDTIREFATCLDIREDSVSELLDFVMENDIELTIPVSEKSLKSNIVEQFTKNGQQIFASSRQAVDFIYDKSSLKKLFYKLHIPTPKFGIFEKQNMVLDYIKNLKNPFVIKTNDSCSATIFTSANSSKHIVDFLFAEKNQKIIIEDYIYGTVFSFYVITDGYKALPVGTSLIYRHLLDGEGGQLTTGMGACSPNYKLSLDNEEYLLDEVVYPILNYLQNQDSPYTGMFAVNGILKEDGSFQILGLDTFMQDADTSLILNNIDEDLVYLMESCIIGSFSDEVNNIKIKDNSAVSVVLLNKNKENSENILAGLELLDSDVVFFPTVKKNRYLEYEANNGPVLVLSNYSSTISSAVKKVYEDAESINFNGVYFRKDICKKNNC